MHRNSALLQIKDSLYWSMLMPQCNELWRIKISCVAKYHTNEVTRNTWHLYDIFVINIRTSASPLPLPHVTTKISLMLCYNYNKLLLNLSVCVCVCVKYCEHLVYGLLCCTCAFFLDQIHQKAFCSVALSNGYPKMENFTVMFIHKTHGIHTING